jgi:hypothetical protein
MYKFQTFVFQKCSYRTSFDASFQQGIAKIKSDHLVISSSADYILDVNGDKVPFVYEFTIHEISFNEMHVAIVLEG